MMNLYSADAIFRESEKEKHEKEILAREKEFNKKDLLQIIEQQQQQIQNYQKQYD